MRRELIGGLLVLLGVILIIIAFSADPNLKVAVSDLLVPVYWIIVILLIVYGLYLVFKRNEGLN